MGLGKRFELTEMARRHFDPPLAIAAAPDHGWLILLHGRPQAMVLDAQLNELRRIELTVGREQHVALSHDGRYLAILGRSELRIADGQGQVQHRVRHPGWPSWAGSGCTFDARDRLWYVRPGDRPGINDRLTAVDPASGETLCEQIIESPQGYARICPSPDPDRVLVEIGCGQDGSYLYLGHLTGSALTVQPYDLGDPAFGGFSPDGTEMVTPPARRG